MSKIYAAIDNGVSGSIAFVSNSQSFFYKTPTKKELSYTKTKQYISRIDVAGLENILELHLGPEKIDCLVLLERPIVNPTRFKATVSGLRAFEATLITVERYNLPFQYEDSKKWQKAMLPSGIKGDELKKASLDIGNRLFPQFANIKHPDRDSLLMAEYARRMQL